MQLEWVSCEGSVWCGLLRVNLDDAHFKDLKGVYIIWSGQRVVRLGSGVIRDRLKDHRDNPEIKKHPDLYVTWARVNANQMEGVEKYLADMLDPIVGERFPERTPIEVNLPW